MIFTILIAILALILLIFLITGLTGAPYVPTHRQDLEAAFTKLYPLKKSDYLIDLGAGDGLVLRLAAQSGATTLGLELNPFLALLAKFRLRRTPRTTIKCRNFYHFSLPAQTTVVYAFADTTHITPIYHKLQREAARLGHPIYFISNAFTIKGQAPLKHYNTFYLYRIPSKNKPH